MSQPEPTPQGWFEEACRAYLELHQGCPWCGRGHCVYKSERGEVLEYRCGTCEFMACHDRQTGRYFMGPGRSGKAPTTMHGL